MDPCIMKTLHAETVNGSVWGHQDKNFPFQFSKRDRFFGRRRMIFGKYGNQPVFCENVKSIKFQIQHVLPYKNQIEKIFFEAGEKILIFHLLQRERKLRMCGTETVDHRSEMVLGEKRKGSDMKGLGFTVLKMGH